MNRTGIFLAVAGVLALVALVVGLPRGESTSPAGPTDRPWVAPMVQEPARAADGSLSLMARLSHPFVSPGRSEVYVAVDVTGVEVPGRERAPVNLAVVIDRSGSMSGPKLHQARQAARQLVGELRATDRLAIVHYGSDVKSLEGLLATPHNKERMLEYIDAIWDDGGTNIGAGLAAGRDLVLTARSDFKVNRIVLISDGQPTEGITDVNALTEVVRETRSHGISLSSIGVGNDFNEELMQAFADIGAGAYAYLRDPSQLASIFQRDLNAATTQVARGVTLALRVSPGARLEEVFGYRMLGGRTTSETAVVALPDFAAGQTERLVARFTIEGAVAERPFEVTALGLEYTDLLHDRLVKSDAQLTALVSDQVDLVLSSRDKDAMVYAARAQSARNTEAAVEALKGGDVGRAEQLVRQNATFFEEARQVVGDQQVAGDLAEQTVLLDGLLKANDDESRNTWKKESRKKARINYGLMGSTY